MHLAYIPGHVARGPQHLDSLLKTLGVAGINIIDPPTHPAAFVRLLATLNAEGAGVAALASTTLAVAAQEDLGFA